MDKVLRQKQKKNVKVILLPHCQPATVALYNVPSSVGAALQCPLMTITMTLTAALSVLGGMEGQYEAFIATAHIAHRTHRPSINLMNVNA